ncbi:MAG: transposase, partial [Bifidobacteriaceae bacterium]|nr:transposase [Bifidobacteriaceae bacterium]
MNYVDTMQKIVIGSLGLEEPWYIKAIEFDDKELELNIYVSIRNDAMLLCPKCNGVTSRNGYEPKSRKWRHGDCMFFPCYIVCKRPKVLCSKCGSEQVNAPFERKNSRFTLLFEGYAMLILADMSIHKTAKLLRCNEKSIDALDKVRRMEQREVRDKQKLYISRRLLMIPNAKLTDEQADKVKEITSLYPKTGLAYSIVTYLDDFYSCNTIETAEDSFTNLCYYLLHSNLKPMQTVYRTLIRHKDKILNYFKNHLTNAIAEGINSIIQTTKRRARGFHTFDTFATMIYL